RPQGATHGDHVRQGDAAIDAGKWSSCWVRWVQTAEWQQDSWAVDTLGDLLALLVTPANAKDREQVAALAAAVQDVTGQTVEMACVDQGYMGEQAAATAAEQGIRLEVVKLEEAKRGFVLLPRR